MIVNWIGPLTGAVGAFFAAWLGAHLGFRRSRKERALERTIAWHEQTIQAIAAYEEQLERIRNYSLHVAVVQPTLAKTSGGEKTESSWPTSIKVPAAMWKELREIENRARAGLRLADLYIEGRIAIDCSVALNNTINLVSSQWIDLGDEPTISQTSFSVKASFSAEVRRKLQESLKVVLEIDGFLASVLGDRYRKWLKMRRIEKIRRDFLREQEEAKKLTEKMERSKKAS